MRDNFNRELALLNKELSEMGAMVESSIAKAVKALIEKDNRLAREILMGDVAINNKEKVIERLCLSLLLYEHPMATDFRVVSSTIKMITDMERIGDHAVDIAELSLIITENPKEINLETIPEIAKKTIAMLNDSLEAYRNKDLQLASGVSSADDEVDQLFEQIKKELTHIIRTDVDASEQAVDLIMVAKYFERIADHAVNIAEWVIFSLTGEHPTSEALQ